MSERSMLDHGVISQRWRDDPQLLHSSDVGQMTRRPFRLAQNVLCTRIIKDLILALRVFYCQLFFDKQKNLMASLLEH